jgi:hypothetical protein
MLWPGPSSRKAASAAAALGLAAAGCNAVLGVDEFSADGCPAPGARKCAGNFVQVCDENGAWTDVRECAKECSEGFCVLECTLGQKRCVGNAPQECDDGEWLDPEPSCLSNAPCFGGVCGAICAAGDLRCDGDKAQICGVDGQWQGDDPCPLGCVDGECASCIPGVRDCVNNTPRLCLPSGEWMVENPCLMGYQCTENGICEEQQ